MPVADSFWLLRSDENSTKEGIGESRTNDNPNARPREPFSEMRMNETVRSYCTSTNGMPQLPPRSFLQRLPKCDRRVVGNWRHRLNALMENNS
jgi:hypothetical protein